MHNSFLYEMYKIALWKSREKTIQVRDLYAGSRRSSYHSLSMKAKTYSGLMNDIHYHGSIADTGIHLTRVMQVSIL